MKKLLLGIGLVSIILTGCSNAEVKTNTTIEDPDSIRTNNTNQTITIPTDL